MGLLDGILGALGPGGDGGSLVTLVTGFLQGQGGLEGLGRRFESAGLGNIFQSWIGKGPNLPIGGDQILKVFGEQDLGRLGQKLGLEAADAAEGLAHFLPKIVDQLTPEGTPVSGPALESGIRSLVSGGIGKLFG
ncbi:MAG: DUF937 domain-containing protein [Verrucomicrobiales bacterium]|nr:DUF937 domain-containing protein [Verrucomicrobiales bacterium]